MNNLNSLILEGKITKDAELIPYGLKIEIVVSRFSKGDDGELKEDLSFFDVEVYGKMALNPKLTKDREIRVVGRLSQKKWKDEEGKEYSRVFVTAEHIEFKPIKK